MAAAKAVAVEGVLDVCLGDGAPSPRLSSVDDSSAGLCLRTTPLAGIDVPILLTGAHARHEAPLPDRRKNLVTAVAIAAGHLRDARLVPEVTILFDDVLLRGNRTVKVHADRYREEEAERRLRV